MAGGKFGMHALSWSLAKQPGGRDILLRIERLGRHKFVLIIA
jgi:hypothetical protein